MISTNFSLSFVKKRCILACSVVFSSFRCQSGKYQKKTAFSGLGRNSFQRSRHWQRTHPRFRLAGDLVDSDRPKVSCLTKKCCWNCVVRVTEPKNLSLRQSARWVDQERPAFCFVNAYRKFLFSRRPSDDDPKPGSTVLN